MALTRERQRQLLRKPGAFKGVKVPIIPYYQRFRYEQEIKGLKDQDELELYPEDTRIFTENVIKRVFARVMQWDGHQWVRARIPPLNRGDLITYREWAVLVPAGETVSIIDVQGKGFLLWWHMSSDTPKMGIKLHIDGVRITPDWCDRPDLLIKYFGGKSRFQELVTYDDVNSIYTMISGEGIRGMSFKTHLQISAVNYDSVDRHVWPHIEYTLWR